VKLFKKSLFVALSLIMVVGLFANEVEQKMTIEEMRMEIERTGKTFEVGLTSVSGKKIKDLCGLVEPKDWRETGVFDGGCPYEVTLPSSFDLRDTGKVSGIRNQGSCGSCWAFGTLASYEGAILFDGGANEDLSEQFLLDCNSHGYDCDGGWYVFDELTGGVPKESCYPYVAYEQSCKTSCTDYYPLSAWYYVGTSSGVPSTTDIKNAIYTHGVVAVAVYVDSYFQSYTSGVFNNTASGSPNHAVALVGWDDSNSCWIMKNSWGTGWGESGYMRIGYGCQQIGYAAAYGIPSGTTPPAEDPYEPNDSYSAAYGPIDSATNYADAEIATSSDEDWFHFTTADTGTITVSVSHESGEDLDWYLYKSTDTSNYVARGYTTSNPETGNYSADWVGKYYVKVVGYNGSLSTFTLNVTYPDTSGGGGTTYYKLRNKGSGLYLDADSGSNYAYQKTDDGGQDKHWLLEDVGSGYYKLTNRAYNLALDVGSGSYVYVYTYNGYTDKHWQLIDLGGGYTRLVNRYSGYSLDINSGSSYVYHFPWTGTDDKYWEFIEVQ
jgi:C1A family cysteine protease